MDLVLYGRVLWRFRLIVVLGLVLAVFLAVLSYYSVSFAGGAPKLTPRKQQVWQAQGTLLATTGQDTKSPIIPSSAYGTLIAYMPYFAKLANSDDVKQLMVKLNGGHPLDCSPSTVPAADTSYGAVSSLPGLSTFGTGATPALARQCARLAINAFSQYFTDQQIAAKLKPAQRIELRVVSQPAEASLIVPRKKTLPIVVFLGIAFLTIALAFILENARPAIRVISAEEPDVIKGVRRTA